MADDNPEREQGGASLRTSIWFAEAISYFAVAIFSVASIHAVASGELPDFGMKVVGLVVPLLFALTFSLRGLWRLRE